MPLRLILPSSQYAFDGVLKRTFQTPVAIEDIVLKIGGRSGYSFTPIYFKDLVLELE